LNINGAINTVSLQVIVRHDDTINAQSTIQLFQQIEAHPPAAAYIHIICDNARYYRSQLIRDYLNDSKIKLVFLPPYASDLNLIERD
jgi:transposase